MALWLVQETRTAYLNNFLGAIRRDNQSLYLNTWHLGVPKFSFKRVRVLEIHPTQPRGGHPSHSNLVRGKLTSPTPNPAGDGTSGLTSYPRRRSKVSEATCLRPQRSAPSRTWTRAVQPRVQRSDHWATHASPITTTYVACICVCQCSVHTRVIFYLPTVALIISANSIIVYSTGFPCKAKVGF